MRSEQTAQGDKAHTRLEPCIQWLLRAEHPSAPEVLLKGNEKVVLALGQTQEHIHPEAELCTAVTWLLGQRTLLTQDPALQRYSQEWGTPARISLEDACKKNTLTVPSVAHPSITVLLESQGWDRTC